MAILFFLPELKFSTRGTKTVSIVLFLTERKSISQKENSAKTRMFCFVEENGVGGHAALKRFFITLGTKILEDIQNGFLALCWSVVNLLSSNRSVLASWDSYSVMFLMKRRKRTGWKIGKKSLRTAELNIVVYEPKCRNEN